jgi:uncharacterized protein YqcC (DUF446 family)
MPTPPTPPVLPIGQGDITDPAAWQDNLGNVPPNNYTNVPQNTNFPRNGDGRYWWTGDLSHAQPGAIYFIGNPSFLAGTIQISWAIQQLSNDGSQMVLSYSLDGGSTFTAVDLPLGLQGLQSGSFDLDLATGPATGLSIKVTYTGGTPNAESSQSEVAVAITRNANSAAIWDNPNPFDPTAYNGQVIDEPGYDNLETLTTRLLIRLGFSNQVDNPPPGMVPMLEEFLQSSQNFLWRTYDQLRTRRWFRWKLIPLQRQYSLLDNDENILQMYSLDPNKTVVWAGIQDTRNVWYPLIQGIPPQLYTMIDKPWRPARYEIRNGLEVYPSPDQTYFLWLKANFGLLSLVNPEDTTTIDSELVFLHALANAKAHYGQPDANNIEAQANRLRAELIATTHKTGHYVPGTIPIPPAVRPTLIQFNDNQSG